MEERNEAMDAMELKEKEIFAATGITQYNVTTKHVVDVTNEPKETAGLVATNFGCIAMDGATAYCMKTDSTNQLSILYRFADYKVQKYDYISFKNGIMGHGNGMTFYEGSLWVATGGDVAGKYGENIIRIKPNADLSKSTYSTFTLGEGKTSSISHYKGKQYIVKTGGATNGDKHYLKYRIGTFHGTTNKFTFDADLPILVENVKYDTDYIVPQDIYYKNDTLYIMLYHKDIKTNSVILVVDIPEVATGEKDLSENGERLYTPREVLVFKADPAIYTQSEVESIDFAPDGKMIMACNKIKKAKPDISVDCIEKEVERKEI